MEDLFTKVNAFAKLRSRFRFATLEMTFDYEKSFSFNSV